MNEYSVLTYGFKENNIRECIDNGKLNDDFHVISEPKDLYDYVRIEDINCICIQIESINKFLLKKSKLS